MDPTAAWNLMEAAFWAGLGVFLLVGRPRAGLSRSRTLTATGVMLLIFAASDLVEMRTGAWWRPGWLLVWKSAVALALLACAARLLYIERKKNPEEK